VPATDYILETRGLTKDFKGFVAVNDVNLRVRRGAIHGLIGPNGAGKTTVFNLLTRFLHPSAGTILFGGRDITHERPAEIARRGVVRSFQISSTFGHLSVLDNVRVALQRKLGVSFHFWRSPRVLDALRHEAVALLESVELAQHAELQAAQLPYGQKRALELATTLALDPELMLLDEPTQGMAHEDVGRVVALIEKVSTNRTVLMVEHNLSVVQDLCDSITVMQRGSILAEGNYQELARNPEVREAYMGAGDD
jgi:branched-chain amino acid transport system ATP-binding protein